MNVSELQELKPGKRRERFQLRRFVECFAELPAGEQEWNRENPDLIIHTAGGRLGIEHTTLYTDLTDAGSRRKEQENLQLRVVDSARAEQRDQPPLSVTVWFDEAVPLTGKTCGRVAAGLADAAQRIFSMAESRDHVDMTRREYERSFANPLPQGILRIQIWREPRSDYAVWWPNIEWEVYDLKVSALQGRIDDKERRLSDYRKDCEVLWLVIASEGLYPSSNFTVSEQVRSHVFQTRFDRVFYFDSLKGDVIELRRAQ